MGPKAIKLLILQWSQWSGLNRRPTVYETVALPLSYIGLDLKKRCHWYSGPFPARLTTLDFCSILFFAVGAKKKCARGKAGSQESAGREAPGEAAGTADFGGVGPTGGLLMRKAFKPA
jgi:hypothetical protein